jgi:Chaperone of endosialidase
MTMGVTISGGTIDNTTIGGTTPAPGTFTSLSASGVLTATGPFSAANPCFTGTLSLSGAGSVTGTNPTLTSPTFQICVPDNATPGAGVFVDSIIFAASRSGGVGHRQTVTAQNTVTGANVGEFNVGLCGFGFMTGGSGCLFGMNAYAQALSAVASTAEVSGMEINTDLRTRITYKTGLQVIDVATSTGDGSSVSTALMLARQTGGWGYQTGIQFGSDTFTNSGGAKTTLIRVGNAPDSNTLQRGIDFRKGVFSAAAIDLPACGASAGEISFNAGAGGAIQSQTASSAPILVFGSGTVAIQNNAGTANALVVSTAYTQVNGTLWCNGNAAPSYDNAYDFGGGVNRWSTIYAVNGTIQTSDPSLKTDIAPLSSMLPIVAAINPVTFKWKSGGVTLIDDTEMQTVQDSVMVDHECERAEVRKGQTVLVKDTYQRKELLFDEIPALDEEGQPIVHHVPAQPEVVDNNGVVKRPATEAYDHPRTHRVPRMVTKLVAVKKPVDAPGKRTHWGFLAPDVKTAFDGIGMDFGGYVLDADGTHHLRPDQLIPVLWKATQELAAKVAALEAR